jgi:hypothetical protein
MLPILFVVRYAKFRKCNDVLSLFYDVCVVGCILAKVVYDVKTFCCMCGLRWARNLDLITKICRKFAGCSLKPIDTEGWKRNSKRKVPRTVEQGV